MTTIRTNIAANLSGRFASMVLGLVFIPFYLDILGVEAYGLIGFYATFIAIFGILDAGLSATLNRELARLAISEDSGQAQQDLLRTFETVFWFLSAIAGMTLAALAPLIASHWVQPEALSVHTITDGVRLMGIIIAMQLPFGLYQSGLVGLQRQVLANLIMVGVGALRGSGAVAVLYLISPTIQAFFLSQLVAHALGVGLCRYYLRRNLPPSESPARFAKRLLVKEWRFSLTISANTIIGVVVTQLDKVILIKLLPLENFGYYMLASTVAAALWSIIVPINNAFFPRFAQLADARDTKRLVDLYHRGSQFVSVALVPAAAIICLFSYELMRLWTGNEVTAENTFVLVALLTLGVALNVLSSFPAYYFAAAGRPQYTLYTNILGALILVPALVLMIDQFGVMGAAIVSVMFNSLYIVLTVPLGHRHMLRDEMWPWYFKDVGIPLAGGLLVAGLFRFAMPADLSVVLTVLYLALTWGVVSLACLALAPQVRRAAVNVLKAYRARTLGQLR